MSITLLCVHMYTVLFYYPCDLVLEYVPGWVESLQVVATVTTLRKP